MANWCCNTVHFTGAPQMLLILHDKLLFAQKEAALQGHAFLAPCIEPHDYQKAFFECDIDLTGDILCLDYQTKWAPNVEDLFLLAYAFNLTCEGSAEESCCWVYEEFRCSESSGDYKFEFRSLNDKDYMATYKNEVYNAYIANPDAELIEVDEDDEDDDRYERLDYLLSSKQWETFDLNPELLKKKVYEPSTQHSNA